MSRSALPPGWQAQTRPDALHQAVRDDGLLTWACADPTAVPAAAQLIDVAWPLGGVCPWPCPWPADDVPPDLAAAGFTRHPIRSEWFVLPGLTITPGQHPDAVTGARAYLDAAATAARTREAPTRAAKARTAKAAATPPKRAKAPAPPAQLELAL